MKELEQQESNEVEEKWDGKSTKPETFKYINHILEMMEGNYTKRQIFRELEQAYNMSAHQCARYFKRASDQLTDDQNCHIKQIRSRRIHALQRDIRTAFKNYEAAEDAKVQVMWFKQYQECKAQLDLFYASALKPIDEGEGLAINISYSQAVKAKE